MSFAAAKADGISFGMSGMTEVMPCYKASEFAPDNESSAICGARLVLQGLKCLRGNSSRLGSIVRFQILRRPDGA